MILCANQCFKYSTARRYSSLSNEANKFLLNLQHLGRSLCMQQSIFTLREIVWWRQFSRTGIKTFLSTLDYEYQHIENT